MEKDNLAQLIYKLLTKIKQQVFKLRFLGFDFLQRIKV